MMENKTILLVEDDFLNRRLSRKILSENGFSVIEAKNAKETLEILKKEKIDLLILDINLGEEEDDGIKIGQQLKEKYHIPFIYLTAYENPEIIDKALITKPYSYLTKPFKNVDLITAVEIALRQSAGLVKHKPTIFVKFGDYNVDLPIDTIDYIESEGNYLLFHTAEKVYKLRSTLKKIMEELPDSQFLQTHRAYIVNKDKIEKYNSKFLVINGKELPVTMNIK